MKARTVAVLVSVALAIGSSGTAVVFAHSRGDAACRNQQALVDGLYKILDRSTERLPQFVADGTITQEQANSAYADNAKSKADIVRPSC